MATTRRRCGPNLSASLLPALGLNHATPSDSCLFVNAHAHKTESARPAVALACQPLAPPAFAFALPCSPAAPCQSSSPFAALLRWPPMPTVSASRRSCLLFEAPTGGGLRFCHRPVIASPADWSQHRLSIVRHSTPSPLAPLLARPPVEAFFHSCL